MVVASAMVVWVAVASVRAGLVVVASAMGVWVAVA